MDENLLKRINKLIKKYMEDYSGGKDIDILKPFDRPDKKTG